MSIKSCFYSCRQILSVISCSVIFIVVIRKLYCYNLKDNCLTYNTPMVISTWAFTNATTKSNDFLITLLKMKYVLVAYSLIQGTYNLSLTVVTRRLILKSLYKTTFKLIFLKFEFLLEFSDLVANISI